MLEALVAATATTGLFALAKGIRGNHHYRVDPNLVVQRIARRGEQESRSDDTEDVVRKRLRVYEEQTAPVAGYYADQGLLTRCLLYTSPSPRDA